MAPPERGGKGRARQSAQQFDEMDDDSKQANAQPAAPIGSPENIDHILDNMFVQRAPYQPPTTRKSSSPSPLSDAPSGKAIPTDTDIAIATSSSVVENTVTSSVVPTDIENSISVSKYILNVFLFRSILNCRNFLLMVFTFRQKMTLNDSVIKNVLETVPVVTAVGPTVTPTIATEPLPSTTEDNTTTNETS